MWFKYGLKAQKLIAQGNGHKQHALKGQKLLAQGNALGIMSVCNAPCKGKSFKKLLPQSDIIIIILCIARDVLFHMDEGRKLDTLMLRNALGLEND